MDEQDKQKIINLRKKGKKYPEIVLETGFTEGQVNGVIYRAIAKGELLRVKDSDKVQPEKEKTEKGETKEASKVVDVVETSIVEKEEPLCIDFPTPVLRSTYNHSPFQAVLERLLAEAQGLRIGYGPTVLRGMQLNDYKGLLNDVDKVVEAFGEFRSHIHTGKTEFLARETQRKYKKAGKG